MTDKTPGITSAILLVGGRGTRLQPLTFHTPKPMLPVAGVPFTEHQIRRAAEAGIDEIVLATSYKSELFEPYFGDGSRFGISISYAVEREPLGTGGAIRNAAELLAGDGAVVIFNGDVLSSHDLRAQLEFHLHHDADVTLYLTEVPDARAFGSVVLDKNHRVTAFLEKMENPPTRIINAGCYIFSRPVIHQIPSHTVVSVERETFPQLIENGAKLFGFIDRSYWLDIGTPRALLKASQDLVLGIAQSPATPAHIGESIVDGSAEIDPTAHISGGSVIGARVRIGADSSIQGCYIDNDVIVGPRVSLSNSFIAQNTEIPAGFSAESAILGYPTGE